MNNDYETRLNIHRARNCLFCQWLNPEDKKDWREFVKREGYRLISPNIQEKIPESAPEYIILLDISPKVTGHTLVIWKYPYDDICDAYAGTAIIEKIGQVISRYSRRIQEKLLAKKVYPYSMCDHFEKWELKTDRQPTTEHLHFHLLPRYSGAPKEEDLFCLPEKKTGVDWEATPITLENLAKQLRFASE